MTDLSYKEWSFMSDKALTEQIGAFVRHHRMEQNRTQHNPVVHPLTSEGRTAPPAFFVCSGKTIHKGRSCFNSFYGIALTYPAGTRQCQKIVAGEMTGKVLSKYFLHRFFSRKFDEDLNSQQ